MNGSNTQKFIELWTNKKQTGDSVLVQSKGTKTIYINSIRIIDNYFCLPHDEFGLKAKAFEGRHIRI